MCCRTRFHADETRLELFKERNHLVAAQLPDENNFVAFINAMYLEDILGKINTDGLNLLHVDALSNDSICDHPTLANRLATREVWASSTASSADTLFRSYATM